jgi:hypothetical protein
MGLGHSPSIVMNGLVYSLDAGNLRSYSGSGLTVNGLVGGIGGTLVGGVGFTSANSGSFIFDGANDYIQLIKPNITNSTTISLWINQQAIDSDKTLINNENDSTGIGNFHLFFDTLENFSGRTNTYSINFFDNNGTSSSRLAFETNSYSLNNWVNFTITFVSNSATGIRGYKNSIESNFSGVSSIGVNDISATSDFKLGKRTISDSRYFNGNISQVQIYNRALTAAEIRQNYNATKKRYGL